MKLNPLDYLTTPELYSLKSKFLNSINELEDCREGNSETINMCIYGIEYALSIRENKDDQLQLENETLKERNRELEDKLDVLDGEFDEFKSKLSKLLDK